MCSYDKGHLLFALKSSRTGTFFFPGLHEIPYKTSLSCFESYFSRFFDPSAAKIWKVLISHKVSKFSTNKQWSILGFLIKRMIYVTLLGLYWRTFQVSTFDTVKAVYNERQLSSNTLPYSWFGKTFCTYREMNYMQGNLCFLDYLPVTATFLIKHLYFIVQVASDVRTPNILLLILLFRMPSFQNRREIFITIFLHEKRMFVELLQHSSRNYGCALQGILYGPPDCRR